MIFFESFFLIMIIMGISMMKEISLSLLLMIEGAVITFHFLMWLLFWKNSFFLTSAIFLSVVVMSGALGLSILTYLFREEKSYNLTSVLMMSFTD